MKTPGDNYPLLIWLLCVTVFFEGSNALRITSYATFGDVVFFATAIIWLILGPLQSHKKPGWLFTSALLLFVISYIIHSLMHAGPSVDNNLIEFVKFIISLFVMVYLITDITHTEQALRWLIVVYVVCATLNAVVGLTDLIGVTHIANYLNADALNNFSYAGRARGLTLHPNHLGVLCATALPLVLALKNEKNSKTLVVVFVLIVAGLLASGSRGSFIGALAAVLFAFRKGLFKSRLKMIASAVVTAAAIVMYVMYFTNGRIDRGVLVRLAGGAGVAASDEVRWNLMYTAWHQFSQNPIAGLGFSKIADAHNIYLQLMQSTGMLGVMAFMLYLGSFVIKANILLKQRNKSSLTVGIVAAIIVYVLSGFFENTIYFRAAIVPFGLLWAAANVSKSDKYAGLRLPKYRTLRHFKQSISTSN